MNFNYYTRSTEEKQFLMGSNKNKTRQNNVS